LQELLLLSTSSSSDGQLVLLGEEAAEGEAGLAKADVWMA
jgi:hypothetical protein